MTLDELNDVLQRARKVLGKSTRLEIEASDDGPVGKWRTGGRRLPVGFYLTGDPGPVHDFLNYMQNAETARAARKAAP